MSSRRGRIGLILSVIWVVACMIALSGKCQTIPDDVRNDRLLNPTPAPTPTPN